MPEHRIRLNRAWEIRAVPLEMPSAALDTIANAPAEERFDLPLLVDGQPIDEQGQPVSLLLSRWFNAPTNVQPGQGVRVELEPAGLASRVRLNGNELFAVVPASRRCVTGETPVPLSLELTGKLQPHNRLDILIGDALALSSASIVLVIEE